MSEEDLDDRVSQFADVVDPDTFKKGMRHVTGACAIIATADKDQWAGLTATAVMSVSAEPARLLTCINRKVWAHSIVAKRCILSVNFLHSEQLDIAMRFAGMVSGVSAQDRFIRDHWTIGRSGAPLLKFSLVSFECRVVDTYAASSHDMFLCEVLAVPEPKKNAQPLLYHDGHFCALPILQQ